jgi:hypothetical protein
MIDKYPCVCGVLFFWVLLKVPSNPKESPKRPGPGAEEKVSGDGGLNPESVLNRLSIFV